MGHTGRVLVCGALGARLASRPRGQGVFVGPIPFCIRIAKYSRGEVDSGLVLEQLYVNCLPIPYPPW